MVNSAGHCCRITVAIFLLYTKQNPLKSKSFKADNAYKELPLHGIPSTSKCNEGKHTMGGSSDLNIRPISQKATDFSVSHFIQNLHLHTNSFESCMKMQGGSVWRQLRCPKVATNVFITDVSSGQEIVPFWSDSWSGYQISILKDNRTEVADNSTDVT